jgi:peptidyl-prolyl cis-trans isomerase D
MQMLRFLRMGSKRTKTIWWIMIVVTVVTFLGGFVFLLGSGLDSGIQAQATGAVGVVDGDLIHRNEYLNAVAEQRMAHQQTYGSDPQDQELKNVESQAWRSLVYQRLLASRAKDLGLKASDGEVVFSLRVTPPNVLRAQPAFQTDGQFDYTKYQAALQDPNNNWGAFEEMTRQEIPVRKLQERLLASIKAAEPELRSQFHVTFDRVDATVVQVPPEMAGDPPTVSEADITRVHEKYHDRFVATAHTELEVLTVPKPIGETEIATARELAQSIADRIKAGEDFTALARDYSEGPAADQGGVIDRAFLPTDFDASLGARFASLQVGQLMDPFQDQTRYVIVRRLEPKEGDPIGSLRLAQIVIRVRANEDQVREQEERMTRIRKQAARTGLGRAATEEGMATFSTGPFTINSPPTVLQGVPEAADWGVSAKVRDISPLFQGRDEFVIVQVTRQVPAGPAPRDEIEPDLRQVAEMDLRLQKSKPRVDAIAQAVAQGQTLEAAAKAQGLEVQTVRNLTRVGSENVLANSPEVRGMLFGAKPGQVVGPFQGLDSWYMARVDAFTPADTASFGPLREQVMNDVVQRRQRMFLASYLNELRLAAKVKDLRGTSN